MVDLTAPRVPPSCCRSAVCAEAEDLCITSMSSLDCCVAMKRGIHAVSSNARAARPVDTPLKTAVACCLPVRSL